jgi:pilus assembly protein Flp/PilA
MERLYFKVVAGFNTAEAIFADKIRKFKSEDEGVTAVEYALIIGLVAIVIIGAITLLGENISNVFSRAACVVKGGTWNSTTNVCS